ncbi:hypothetical protein RC54_11340 [Herbaspirillum rubrisubalbicans]|uniref:Uncharacterized protein n=1 Tax=Herbaspirillum rubrisubalbicans TaxID=80842 RepID=A0AAD0U796_9BURK|nr:hypothetical protein RC54_11340 [Herbaspirillum rubrisubalbicans]
MDLRFFRIIVRNYFNCLYFKLSVKFMVRLSYACQYLRQVIFYVKFWRWVDHLLRKYANYRWPNRATHSGNHPEGLMGVGAGFEPTTIGVIPYGRIPALWAALTVVK